MQSSPVLMMQYQVLLQVDFDFQCLHKKALNMLTMFDNTKIKLIRVIDQRLKDPTNKKLYNDMIENSQMTESKFNLFKNYDPWFCRGRLRCMWLGVLYYNNKQPKYLFILLVKLFSLGCLTNQLPSCQPSILKLDGF